ncbi:MAG: TIGR00282 family metallophosphoesterase [Verrucomicrobiota bacterium]
MLKLFFVGDIVGRPGREILTERLPRLRSELGVDVVIANGENAAAGSGITESIAKSILTLGVDAITLGDHVWDQRGWEDDIGGFERVCRPANLPAVCPGRDHLILNVNGFRLGVFTVLGRQFMKISADCPFKTCDDMLARLEGQVDGVFVEFHAEATSEKQALGWYLDGRAICVLGTHTHVPTADAEVLPQGTAFMCDVGMTGPYASVLGRSVGPVVAKFRDGMPRRFDIAEGDVRISGACVEYDPESKRVVKVEHVTVRRNNAGLAASRL